MDQQHHNPLQHHHHQLIKLTTTTTTSTPPQPQPLPFLPASQVPTNLNNSNSQECLHLDEAVVNDTKNGVVSYLPPTVGRTSGVRYKECLKNHAASVGANVVDGCGEFMPSGKEGTFEALKCAACQCHRNFHRRDPHDSSSAPFPCRSLVLHLPHPHHQIVQPMTVAYGGGPNSESSSDDLVQVFDEMPQRDHNLVEAAAAAGSNRKRFRTKFTQEQKDKMLEFAERLGWRLQRQDDEMVERFCNEVGVRRQVLKVWMHNNKNSFKKQPASFVPDPDHEHKPQPQHEQLPQIHQLLHLHQQQDAL